MYYCDPAWHNDETADANVVIMPADDSRRMIDPGFATCWEHVSLALRIMLSRNKLVKVREVHN